MMQPTLQDLEWMAWQAGAILRAGYGRQIQIDYKGVIDLVTEIDRASEAFLLEAICSRFPGHQVVAEESGVLAGSDSQVWFVDPLDGTVNYAHGVPIFAVSLAYAVAGQVALAAIFDPMRDELYTAERGRGAWLNGQQMRVSVAPALAQSLLVTGFPYDVWSNSDNNLDHYAAFALKSRGVRRLGSAAIDLGYVAAGRFDGFWEIRIAPYDIAAGALIVQEAGGIVTDMYGCPDYLAATPSIVAANPQIHSQMVELLGKRKCP
jgi:myo-inositol-1(or 4)-monophosphatase